MKLIIICYVFIYSLMLYGQLYTADNEWAGIAETYIHNNSGQGYIIQCYTGIMWCMPELNNSGIAFIRKRNIISWGVQTVFSANKILGRALISPIIMYNNENISVCVKPSMKYRRFCDNVHQINADISAYMSVLTEYIRTTMAFQYRESEIYSYIIGSIQQQHYSVDVQAGYNRILDFGIRCNVCVGNNIILSCYCDNACRLGGGVRLGICQYALQYNMLYKNPLGYSHSIYLSLIMPDDFQSAHISIPVYSTDPIALPVHREPFNLNTASLKQISSIKGIGMKTALKILLKRIILNGYSDYAEIFAISGIGEKTLQIIKQNTYLGEKWKGK